MKIENFYKHPAIIFYRQIETECIKRVMKGRKIKSPSLDLGCGDGKITNYLFGKVFDYGLDIDEVGDVKIARKNKIYKKILIEDATKISLKDNSLNFIFSNSVIEHIPDIDKVLGEVSRTMKKNGYFLMSVPTDNFKKNLFFSNPIYSYFRNKMLNHHHLYNHKKWEKLLKKNNLKIVKYEYCITKDQLRYWDFLALVNKYPVIANVVKQSRDNLSPNIKITKYSHVAKAMRDKQNIKISNGSNLVILAQKI